MKIELEMLVEILRDRLKKISPEERQILIRSIIEGYCRKCGYSTDECNCHFINIT